jgi:hypothetical protein
MTSFQVTHQYVVFEYNGKYIGEAVFSCDSGLVCKNQNYKLIHKKINTLNGTQFDIHLTFTLNEDDSNDFILLRGYIYKNNKEYNVESYQMYASKQIGDYCYDKIGVCKISEYIFG